MSPIVSIPGMPGESIDSRILPDVLALIKQYKVKITDGFATSGHAPGGEHPLGLAVDIVPDTARGGTWEDVDRLAAWAEPKANAPRSPFRWVGYNGDPNHGKGNHLHLSWLHPGGKVVTGVPNAKDGGGGLGISATDAAAAVIAGPLGLAASATGVLGKAGEVAGDAATTAAKALLNVLWDAFGESGVKILLYIALTAGGATLAVIGVSRALGVRAPNPVKLAVAATPVGRGAAMAKAAA
ncbi:MAG TPA: hypothetical protein VMY78_09890 [Solirubrobacteraceae bacterium]|nr:hypothetical protein [Solirubrobacteraceae bacterium]